MNTAQQIAFYSTGYYISLAVMAAGFVLAAVFFVCFGIPETLYLMKRHERERRVKGERKAEPGGRTGFRIIEQLMVTHTDEFI